MRKYFFILLLLVSCGKGDEHATAYVSGVKQDFPTREVECTRRRITHVSRCLFSGQSRWCHQFAGIRNRQWVLREFLPIGSWYYPFPDCYQPRRGHFTNY